ncbi:MAG TPA: co-chaperone GroES [Agriterribacter sp.]|nr:co-chaperone GroES [Agriterribacter sp.]
MQPIREIVLFKPMKGADRSEGGIIVPESFQRISDKGIIVAVGCGSKRKKMMLKPGQTAYRVHGWSAAEVEIDGELHYLLNQDAIIALQ